MPTYLTLASQGAAVRKALATSDHVVYLKPLLDEAADTDTARHGVIQTVFDAFATAGGGTMDMRGCIDVGFNSQLRLRTGDVTILANGEIPSLLWTGAAGTIAFDIGADDANDAATTPTITNINLGAFILKSDATDSSAALLRAQRTVNLTLDGTAIFGGYNNCHFVGTMNTTWHNVRVAPRNLVETAGSSAIRVSAIEYTDGSRFSGFTTRLLFGRPATGSVRSYDELLLIEATDYFHCQGIYFGNSKKHVTIRRQNAGDKLVDVRFDECYFDGVATDRDTDCVEIDGNDLAVTGDGSFGWFQFGSNTWFGQCRIGVKVPGANTSRFTGPIVFDGARFNNNSQNGITCTPSVGSNCDLIVANTVHNAIGKDGAPVTPQAIAAINCRSVKVSDSFISCESGVERGVFINGCTTTTVSDTTVLNAEKGRAISFGSNQASVTAFGNDGDQFIMPRNSRLEKTYVPEIAFGGASVGVTYNANTRAFYLTTEGRIQVWAWVQLTANGSSTGAASVTLPVAAAGSGGAWALEANIDGVAFAASVANGASVATITSADNTDVTDTSTVIVTGVYTPA